MTPNEQKTLDRIIQLMGYAMNAPDNWKNNYISDALTVAHEMKEDRPKVIRLFGGAA